MDTETAAAVSQAIALFDQQKYQEAFEMFVEAYRQCRDLTERQKIFQMLEEVYYLPNVEELRQTYESNVACLKKYRYFWNKTFHDFDELSFQLFPITDELYYCYNRENCQFSGLYDAKTSSQMRYFFENLDKPLRIEDEDNFYNLTFLNDNVRRSEDFAGDNHIYLLYTSLEPLERLMLTCDLEPVLRQRKFVFLVGENNWDKYPINFRKKYGIDFSQMRPAPIRINEIKRICFWYKHAHSGTIFSLGVLGAEPCIQSFCGSEFFSYSSCNGNPLCFTPEFKEILAQVDRVYTIEQILEVVNSDKYFLKIDDLQDYINWLQRRQPAPKGYTVKDLFCGYFLFHYEKRNLNPRISPMLLFDPHMWDPSAYESMVLSFPYYTVLTCVREPIMRFARSYLVGLVGWDESQTRYLLGMDYCNTQYLNPMLLPHYYGYRFEDMKTKPDVVCRAVCRHLNVPYDEQMLQAEAPMKDNWTGAVTKGFDTAPLHRDISVILSEFDQLRLKMFYEPILRYYGYPTFSFEEHPLSEETVRELFRVPFRFEYINDKLLSNPLPQEVLHKCIQDVLQKLWRKKFVSPKLIPLEETDNE